jgi:DNA-binding CsgD family transcriptional regulator
MARPQAPSSLTRFLTRHVPTSLSLSSAWLAVPAEYAVQFEVDPAVLLPNVSLAAPALVDAMGRVAGPVLLAPAEDLDVYQAMPALPVEAPGAAPWYAAGARAVVPLRGSSGALLALWVLGAYFSGDLFEREDLTALERIAVLTGMQLEREALRGGVRTDVAPSFLEPEVLTAREQQVLELLARGYSNRQIADELIIVLRKLDLENRAQAIVWAHEHRSRVAR